MTSATYEKDGESTAREADFINTYNPDEVAYTPKVTKTITGQTPAEEGAFTFTLAVVTGGAPMPANNEVTVTTKGTAPGSFGWDI